MISNSLPRQSLHTLADHLRRSLAGRIFLCITASMLVAAAAHLSTPMPMTPIPTTLQTLAIVLVGLVLGPVDAFAALVLYLAEGAVGLPVFSPQGPGGLLQLLGPTAGYLFAYPFAAALAGASVRRLQRAMDDLPAALLSGLIAIAPIFAVGSIWLSHLLGLTVRQGISLAITPFLAAEIIKLTVAAAAYKALHVARSR